MIDMKSADLCQRVGFVFTPFSSLNTKIRARSVRGRIFIVEVDHVGMRVGDRAFLKSKMNPLICANRREFALHSRGLAVISGQKSSPYCLQEDPEPEEEIDCWKCKKNGILWVSQSTSII